MGRLADLAEEEIREAFYKKARELGVPLADLPADAIELIYTTFRLDYLGGAPSRYQGSASAAGAGEGQPEDHDGLGGGRRVVAWWPGSSC